MGKREKSDHNYLFNVIKMKQQRQDILFFLNWNFKGIMLCVTLSETQMRGGSEDFLRNLINKLGDLL